MYFCVVSENILFCYLYTLHLMDSLGVFDFCTLALAQYIFIAANQF